MSYHIVSSSAVISQSHLVVLAGHVVSSQPDGVVRVGAGQQTLGELHCSINSVGVNYILHQSVASKLFLPKLFLTL